MDDLWETPPPVSAAIAPDTTQEQLDLGIDAEPAAWMWAPVLNGQQGEWRRGYTTWDAMFGAACAWLRAEYRAFAGGAS